MTKQNALKVKKEIEETDFFKEGAINVEITTASSNILGSKVIVYMTTYKTSFYYTKLASYYDGNENFDSVSLFRYNDEKQRLELQIF